MLMVTPGRRDDSRKIVGHAVRKVGRSRAVAAAAAGVRRHLSFNYSLKRRPLVTQILRQL